jgi:hydroxyacylglutathione hydrolase
MHVTSWRYAASDDSDAPKAAGAMVMLHIRTYGRNGMFLRQIYHDGLAQASYLIGCQATGEAIVIDPNRDIGQYIEAAQRAGLRITAVTETHIHADYVSGARELAQRTGAQLYLSNMGPAEWKYAYAGKAGATLLHHGDHFMVGNIRLEVLHTPGHTPEHIAFLVSDTAHACLPMGIASGDFVFVGDVGRPDLLERAAGFGGTMRVAARQLYHSLERFRELPDYLQVWPGHGAGSACGKALGAVPQSTVGYEKAINWALDIRDETAFVAAVLDGQPDPPPYFAQMKRVNKAGPAPRPASLPPQRDRDQLASALAGELLVVDTRPADAYAAGHLPGTINIPAGTGFLTWAGWLLPYDRPIGLIVEEAQLRAVRDELLLIGLDQVVGYWTPAALDSQPLARYERRPAAELRPAIARNGVLLLDVRTPTEYAAGHIAGSQNIPLGRLAAAIGELPADQPAIVYCQGASRSPIAASMLQAHGWETVTEMNDGFDGWQAAGAPVER